MKRIAYLALVSLTLLVLLTSMTLAQTGPKIDVLRYEVLRNPSFDFYPPWKCYLVKSMSQLS